MIELKILIDELDYDSIADYLIPALAESMAKRTEGRRAGRRPRRESGGVYLHGTHIAAHHEPGKTG